MWCATNLCNAKCIHCSSAANLPYKNELTTHEAKKMIKELSDVGIVDLAFSGGEPLLRRDIFTLIQYSVDLGLTVGVGTNGLIFNEKIARHFYCLGVARVQVSLDGSTPFSHDKIRTIPGCLDKAINAVKLSKAEGLVTHACFTPNRINCHELGDVIDLCVKLGVDLFNLSQFVPIGRGSKNLDLNPIEWKAILEVWHDKKHTLGGHMKFTTHEAQLVLVEPELLSSPSFIGCQAGNMVCCISAEGSVYPCVMLPLNIGNIRKRNFREVWETSIIIKNLRDRTKLLGRCGKCPHKDVCGGCRGVAFAYSYYLDEDPHCWYNN